MVQSINGSWMYTKHELSKLEHFATINQNQSDLLNELGDIHLVDRPASHDHDTAPPPIVHGR
ncbi:hypothetical protein BLOT_002561 [Blomia tropicalis]|nr:hypothetical protein BLOT_002561 [Blomia tropicalis]